MNTKLSSTFLVLLLLVSIIPMQNSILEEESKLVMNTSAYEDKNASFVENGTHSQTTTSSLGSWENNKMRVPEGYVVPIMRNQTPTGGWDEEQLFNSWSGSTPTGYYCGGGGHSNAGGNKLKTHVSGYNSAGYAAHCRAAHGRTHNLNLSYQGWTTGVSQMGLIDGRVHANGGTDIFVIVNGRRAIFSLVETTSGSIDLVNDDWRNSAFRGVSCGNQATPFPDLTTSSNPDWHDWRVILDANNDHAYVYQDTILRCSKSIATNYDNEHHNQTGAITKGGGNRNDHSTAIWNSVVMHGGKHLPKSSARWTSPTVSLPYGSYEELQFDWWAGGIGTATAMRSAAKLTLVDAVTMVPFPNHIGIAMPNGVHNISDLPNDKSFKIIIDWHEGLHDLYAFGNFSVQYDGSQFLDLQPISVDFGEKMLRAGDVNPTDLEFGDFGAQQAGAIYEICLSIDGNEELRISRNIDNASSPHTVADQLITLPSSHGVYDVEMEVDCGYAVTELNEVNNILSEQIRVHPSEGPVAALSTPGVQSSDKAVNATVLGSVAGLMIEILTVDWGDGTIDTFTGVGPYEISHLYHEFGEYDIALNASLVGGYESEITTLSGRLTNTPPVAVLAQSDGWSEVGQQIIFDASQSSDHDHEQLTYKWFLDGELQEVTSQYWLKSFDEIDNHSISLVVTDPEGLSDSVTISWGVELAMGSSIIERVTLYPGASTQYEGEEVQFQIEFSDAVPIEYMETLQLSFTKSNGDSLGVSMADGYIGTIAEGLPQGIHVVNIGAEIQDVHERTHSDTYALNLFIENAPPTAIVNVSNTTVFENEEILFDWSQSSDSIWDIDTLTTYATINGVREETYEPNAGNISMTFNESGTYEIRIYVVDSNEESSYAEFSIEVVNAVPHAEVSCTKTELEVNETFSCEVFNVSETANDVDSLTFVWDTDEILAMDDLGNNVIEGEWKYPVTSTLNLTITDTDGASSVVSTVFIVHDIDSGTTVEEPDDNTNATDNTNNTDGGEEVTEAASNLNQILIGVMILLIVVLAGVVVFMLKGGKNEDDMDKAWVTDSDPFEQSHQVETEWTYVLSDDGYYYRKDQWENWDNSAFYLDEYGNYIEYQ